MPSEVGALMELETRMGRIWTPCGCGVISWSSKSSSEVSSDIKAGLVGLVSIDDRDEVENKEQVGTRHPLNKDEPEEYASH
jgi:hypothetical protein